MPAGVAGIDARQKWMANAQLLAADATRTIQAAKASPVFIVVRQVQIIIRTSAAQAITIQDASGVVVLGVIEASAAVGVIRTIGPFEKGIPLPAGQALVALPAAAGPAAAINAEGYYDGFTSV
jgi:hypothetical protein